MYALILAAAVAAVGGGQIEQPGGCNAYPSIAVEQFTVATQGGERLDPEHAVLTVVVPLLTPDFTASILGGGLRWESKAVKPAGGVSQGLAADEERRAVALPPLRAGTRYDVALTYTNPPFGCQPHQQYIGSFTTP